MRWAIAVLLLLTGCVRFHPLHPNWKEAREASAKQDGQVSAADERAMLPVKEGAEQWQIFGHSHHGRPLLMRRVGTGPRRVLWIGGIHGNEREGVIATRSLANALEIVDGALEVVTLTIVEDVNPDGTVLKRRGNAMGIDLNRNYPASNFLVGPAFGERPLDQPESMALHALIESEKPDLVIVAHSWSDDHFINFDGPAIKHAELFSRRSGYRVKPSDRITPTPGSLGSWVGRTLGIPILTVEYERGADPIKCWLATKNAILSVIVSA